MAGEGSNNEYDMLFDVLADQRRRRSLLYLLDSDTSATVDELATELVAWESEAQVTGAVRRGKDAMKTSLVHSHLPKMDDADLIEYDASTQVISATSYCEEARKQLEAMQQ